MRAELGVGERLVEFRLGTWRHSGQSEHDGAKVDTGLDRVGSATRRQAEQDGGCVSYAVAA